MSESPLVVEPAVALYWRPGCGFCSSLRRRLDAIGLDYVARDIWEDEDAAAFVRAATGGDETVPTVQVGRVALVNPTADEVMIELAERAPDAIPAGYELGSGGGVGRALRRTVPDDQM